MTPEEEIAVIKVRLRLEGIHPHWIRRMEEYIAVSQAWRTPLEFWRAKELQAPNIPNWKLPRPKE